MFNTLSPLRSSRDRENVSLTNDPYPTFFSHLEFQELDCSNCSRLFSVIFSEILVEEKKHVRTRVMLGHMLDYVHFPGDHYELSSREPLLDSCIFIFPLSFYRSYVFFICPHVLTFAFCKEFLDFYQSLFQSASFPSLSFIFFQSLRSGPVASLEFPVASLRPSRFARFVSVSVTPLSLSLSSFNRLY